MANTKVMASLAGLAAAVALAFFSPETEIMAAEKLIKTANSVKAEENISEEESSEGFDMTDEKQWEGKLLADVDDCMNIRKAASRSSAVIGTLKKNEIATVISVTDGWKQITIGDLEGYVSDQYTLTGKEAYEYAMDKGCMAATVIAEEACLYEEDQQLTENSVKEGEQYEVAVDAEAEIGKVAVFYKEEICYVDETAVETAFQLTPLRRNGNAYAGTQEDLDLLAALLECEAGGTSYEGLLAVASVVMNRIESDRFPNTVYDVIYQKSQFTPAMNGKVSRVQAAGRISEDAYAAAAAALRGERNTDCLFFNSARTGHRGTLIGGNVFF